MLICAKLFFVSVFDPRISQGRFFLTDFGGKRLSYTQVNRSEISMVVGLDCLSYGLQ